MTKFFAESTVQIINKINSFNNLEHNLIDCLFLLYHISYVGFCIIEFHTDYNLIFSKIFNSKNSKL